MGVAVHSEIRQAVSSEPRSRRLGPALVCAGAVHAVMVGVGAWLASFPLPEPGLDVASSEATWTVELAEEQPAEAPKESVTTNVGDGNGEPAGESVERSLPRRATRPPPKPLRSKPRRIEAPVESATELAPEPASEPDPYAPEMLFANIGARDALVTAPRPRAAFRRFVRRRASGEVLEQQAELGRDDGGQRVGAGRGGHGTSGIVGEPFAFGGAHGAFDGRVCFISSSVRSIQELGQCETVLRFRTSSINVPSQPFDIGFPGIPERDEWFAIFYTGDFEVERPGNYQFRVISDDGSLLFIDGRRVVDNDGIHGPREQKGSIHLTSGAHRFELRYFQGPRMTVALQLFTTAPGDTERLFRPKL